MNKKTVISILVVLVIICGGWYVRQHTSPAPSNTTTVVPPNTSGMKTFTDATTGISFSYPETIPTTYISTTDWPPAVQLVDQAFTCTPAGSETAQAGQTQNETINGHIYCLTRESEGAAGSTYTTYAYALAHNNQTVILTFSLRYVQCGNYDGAQQTACNAERTSFDLSSVDQIVDTIAQSLNYAALQQ